MANAFLTNADPIPKKEFPKLDRGERESARIRAGRELQRHWGNFDDGDWSHVSSLSDEDIEKQYFSDIGQLKFETRSKTIGRIFRVGYRVVYYSAVALTFAMLYEKFDSPFQRCAMAFLVLMYAAIRRSFNGVETIANRYSYALDSQLDRILSAASSRSRSAEDEITFSRKHDAKTRIEDREFSTRIENLGMTIFSYGAVLVVVFEAFR